MSRYRVQYAPTAQAALEAMDRSLRNSFEQGMRQPAALWRRPAPESAPRIRPRPDRPRHTARRPLAPPVAAPREPVDPARIGRRVVRRWAKGMNTGAVANDLEDARQASRHEDLAADDLCGA
ncbi:hypothetical protein [Streptomyces sp. NBC_01506]|uniref:hypothetical protein n=1 Tax=Streptomyces sp. NBC_01506 TaxID=2903887 RepID=UPI003870E13B